MTLGDSGEGPPDDECMFLLIDALKQLGRTEQADRLASEVVRTRSLRDPEFARSELERLGAWVGLDRSGTLVAVDFSGVHHARNREFVRFQSSLVLSGLQGLRALNVAHLGIDGRFADALSELKSLERLVLHHNDVGANVSEAIRALSKLKRLHLSDTNLDDTSLAELRGLSSLEILWLSGTRITDEAMTHIATLSGLQCLHLERTDITASGIERLAALTQLRAVFLGGSRVTHQDIQRLQELLPNVELRTRPRAIVNVAGSSSKRARLPVHGLDDELQAPSLLCEDAVAYVDRLHQYNGADSSGIPSVLIGAEYIRSGNEHKDVADFELRFDLATQADLYLFVDNRVGDPLEERDDRPDLGNGTMDWVASLGFVDTGWEIGIDEITTGDDSGTGAAQSVESTASVFVLKRASPGRYELGAQHAGSPNMYGVAAVPTE